MKGLFGISNTSIHHVWHLISVNPNIDVSVFEPGSKKPLSKIVLVPTIQTVINNIETFNKSDSIFFVFDAPVLLEYLRPIVLLDVEKKTSSFSYKFRDLTFDLISKTLSQCDKAKSFVVTKKVINVIPVLLGKQSSFLTPIMTYLYLIPKGDGRYKYSKIIYDWLRTPNAPVEDLKIGANTASKTLFKFLKSERGITAKTAVEKIWALKKLKKPCNYKKLAKEHQVNVFDLKYLVKAIVKMDNVKDYPDENNPLTIKQIYKNSQTTQKKSMVKDGKVERTTKRKDTRVKIERKKK